MTELSEKALLQVRLRFLDLIKSFFMEEPDAESMSRWRGMFSAISKETVNPDIDASARELAAKLGKKSLQELKDEYYKLFVDPFSDQLISLEGSYYSEGRGYGTNLIAFRELLAKLQFNKEDHFKLPEDSLVFLLDVQARLVEEEKAVGNEPRDAQREILEKYLNPLAEKLTEVFQANKNADFYASCSLFLTGYLELEKGLLLY